MHSIVYLIMLCENVYKTFTHKWNKPDSSHWVRTYDNHLLCTLSHTNLLPTVGYLRFLFVPSSSKNLKSFLMFESCTHGNTLNTVHVYTREHSEHSVAACGNNENLRGMWKQWKKTGKQFFTLFFCGFSLGSHGGVGWELLRVATSKKIIWDLCHVICLVRWIMGRIGKVGREVVKTLDYQW